MHMSVSVCTLAPRISPCISTMIGSSLQLTPPPISSEDAHKGLLSLLERGLIPVSAERSAFSLQIQFNFFLFL